MHLTQTIMGLAKKIISDSSKSGDDSDSYYQIYRSFLKYLSSLNDPKQEFQTLFLCYCFYYHRKQKYETDDMIIHL